MSSTKARVCLALLAALIFLSATPFQTQAQTLPPSRHPTLEASQAITETAFQRGLLEVQRRRYQEAMDAFVDAAWGGDAQDGRYYRPDLRSLRPEVYFNLGLAAAQIPGREIQAIAGFRIYVLLQPAAANASAVRSQINALEAVAINNVRLAAARTGGLIPPTVQAPDNDVVAWRNALDQNIQVRSASAWLFNVYAYLGDKDRAFRALEQHLGANWAATSMEADELVRQSNEAAASDVRIWPQFVSAVIEPNRRYGYLGQFYYALEVGDLARAREITLGFQASDQAGYWVDLACAAKEAHAEALVSEAGQSALSSGLGDHTFQYVAAMVELGMPSLAQTAVQHEPHPSEELSKLLDPTNDIHARPCTASWSTNGARPLWYGPHRLEFLQSEAHLGSVLTTTISEASTNARNSISQFNGSVAATPPAQAAYTADQVLIGVAAYAQELRMMHGPW